MSKKGRFYTSPEEMEAIHEANRIMDETRSADITLAAMIWNSEGKDPYYGYGYSQEELQEELDRLES